MNEHFKYFNLSAEEKLAEEDFNREQHFLIVTDGTGFKTRNVINYWKKSKLDIGAIVYQVYETDSGGHLIEFNTYSPFQDVIEYEETSFVLNTNYGNNKQAHQDMLANEKAAAYYEP